MDGLDSGHLLETLKKKIIIIFYFIMCSQMTHKQMTEPLFMRMPRDLGQLLLNFLGIAVFLQLFEKEEA